MALLLGRIRQLLGESAANNHRRLVEECDGVEEEKEREKEEKASRKALSIGQLGRDEDMRAENIYNVMPVRGEWREEKGEGGKENAAMWMEGPPMDAAVPLPEERDWVSRGDIVVATARLSSSDPAFLSFDRDATIEVKEVHGDGTFTGCLTSNRIKIGLVKLECVKRVRSMSMSLGTPTHSHVSLDSPSPIGAASRMWRKESTILPRPPAAGMSRYSVATPCADYVNTEVSSQSWYMGELDRAESEARLRGKPNGTFLVRFSPNKHSYAISCCYEDQVKHMAVENKEGEGIYYLDEGYVFNSIVELINYYREHNLSESFTGLNTILKTPLSECKMYRVLHEYSSAETKFLSLKQGELVMLVDTQGEERGWWKGAIGNKMGYFPKAYVEPLTPSSPAGSPIRSADVV